MKRVLRFLGVLVVVFAALAIVLYALGARPYLDGGGGFHVAFSGSADSQARAVEAHRTSQQADAPPVSPPTREGGTQSDTPNVPGASPVSPSVADDWTDFRGPLRDGHYRTQAVSTTWPASGLTPLWRQPIGAGYASFVTAGGRAFTIEQRRDEEVVSAYDIATGREIWTNRWSAAFRELMGGDGPRATPTYADGLVYSLGGDGELRAIEAATGRTRWRTNILQDASATNLQWGMSASPLVVDNLLVVLPGGQNGKSVAAYDRHTGRLVWTALDDRAAYSSPMLVTLAGVRQIVVFTASRLLGLSIDGARVLWEYPWRTQYDVNAGQPLVVQNSEDRARVFLSSGYGTGAAVIELTRSGDAFEVREVWRNIRMKNQFTSSLLHDGFIYGLDEAILACLDAGTGELKWKGGRYGYGQVMLANGYLVVLTEEGDLVLVRATPERHVELARSAAIDGKTWNHPAMTGGLLLVRNVREMAAFDLRSK